MSLVLVYIYACATIELILLYNDMFQAQQNTERQIALRNVAGSLGVKEEVVLMLVFMLTILFGWLLFPLRLIIGIKEIYSNDK